MFVRNTSWNTCMHVLYYARKAEMQNLLQKGVRWMDEMNVTEALLKAILELIEKCDTLEELRESVKRIMNE